jgi:hypothetical protein
MTNCKSALTSFLSGVKLEDGGDTPLVDSTLYRQLVGILLYLTHSKPDLSYVVGAVSRFMQELHELHWKDTKCILRNVQGTITFGIHYATDSTLDLIGFTDSEYLVAHSVLVPSLSVGRARSRMLFLFLRPRQSIEG